MQGYGLFFLFTLGMIILGTLLLCVCVGGIIKLILRVSSRGCDPAYVAGKMQSTAPPPPPHHPTQIMNFKTLRQKNGVVIPLCGTRKFHCWTRIIRQKRGFAKFLPKLFPDIRLSLDTTLNLHLKIGKIKV